MSRTLLIDADIVAYRASAGTQKSYDWGDGETSVVASEEEARRFARDTIDQLMEELKADDLVVCLSDDFNNFRKGVDPTYKSARATVERPVHLYGIKDWLYDRYPCDRRRYLEADDVMGILSTEPHQGDRIIVSADKDMMTIPGLLYRPQGGEVQQISLEQADKFHLYQTLIGDSTDGYKGCPGVGPLAASRALGFRYGFESYVHTFKSGPRKGTDEIRWREVEMNTAWDVVVSLYAKAGLKERHALTQARLARILRHDEWNGRPILWKPPAE